MNKFSLKTYIAVVVVIFTASNSLQAQWAQTGGPYGVNINSLALSGANLFVGTDVGVFLSTDNGASWTDVNAGLTNYYIKSFAISNTNLFAGTYWGGVWKRPLSEIITSVEELSTNLPKRFNLNQNYPNPFNPSTTILYQIKEEGFVRLKVYNLLGQEVAALVNEIKPAGEYSFRFDAANLTSGIYIYSLKVNDFVQNNKMTLLK